MREVFKNGKSYKLPETLSEFQQNLFINLINLKWDMGILEPGLRNGVEYDAIIPKDYQNQLPMLYEHIKTDFKKHCNMYPTTKLHPDFYHMVSSQVATLNLLLPILLSNTSNEVLAKLKPDFAELATDKLYKGFRFEFWDGVGNSETGLLYDHEGGIGTDSDMAIAYYNHHNELCLWMIEHKLKEQEFTTCGGFRSKARDKTKHRCNSSFKAILENKNLCVYHDHFNYNYWNLTQDYSSHFQNFEAYQSCPFQLGINQLWRNQLLGFAIANVKEGPFKDYKNVYFSVVKHPQNIALNSVISEYQSMMRDTDVFSVFTSDQFVKAAMDYGNPDMINWSQWYQKAYFYK